MLALVGPGFKTSLLESSGAERMQNHHTECLTGEWFDAVCEEPGV